MTCLFIKLTFLASVKNYTKASLWFYSAPDKHIENKPAQATGPMQIGRDSMHSLTLGPWLKDDLSFTIGLSTIPRAGEGNASRHLLALKTSIQKRGISLPLPFHWPKQGPWPYPTARGQRSILNCVFRRRNVEAVNTLMSQTL